MSKPKVAFFDFASCEGCQLTVLACEAELLDILGAIEIVNFREAISDARDDYEIAFIEGSCNRKMDEERLKKIRAQAKLVVTIGACSTTGGINAGRNKYTPKEALDIVYHEAGELGHHHDIQECKKISDVIKVDAHVPGCPIDKEEFIKVVKSVLANIAYIIPNKAVCVECKMNENECLVNFGIPCLGGITMAGCGAVCPSVGQPCDGCRGHFKNNNPEAMQKIFVKMGFSEDFAQKRDHFYNYNIQEAK